MRWQIAPVFLCGLHFMALATENLAFGQLRKSNVGSAGPDESRRPYLGCRVDVVHLQALPGPAVLTWTILVYPGGPTLLDPGKLVGTFHVTGVSHGSILAPPRRCSSMGRAGPSCGLMQVRVLSSPLLARRRHASCKGRQRGPGDGLTAALPPATLKTPSLRCVGVVVSLPDFHSGRRRFESGTHCEGNSDLRAAGVPEDAPQYDSTGPRNGSPMKA